MVIFIYKSVCGVMFNINMFGVNKSQNLKRNKFSISNQKRR